MINHFSKNKRAAWKFIEFLTGKEAQKVNSTVGGRLPIRTAVYRDPEVLRKKSLLFRLFDCLLPFQTPAGFAVLTRYLRNHADQFLFL